MTLKWSSQYAPVDADFDNVSLLLKGEGTNGNTTILDSSTNNLSVTTVGDAQISTAVTTPFNTGDGVLSFDGTGDYLSLAHNSVFEFGSAAFTVEFWLKTTTTTISGIVAHRSGSGANNTNWVVYVTPTGRLQLYVSDGVSYVINGIVGGTVNDGSWHHCALVRDGNTFTLYVDGVSVVSAVNSSAIPSTSLPLYVAVDNPGSVELNGYISNLRITKGVARYTENFEVPAAVFPIYSPTTRIQA